MRAALANKLAFRWRVHQLHRKPLAYYTERLKAIAANRGERRIHADATLCADPERTVAAVGALAIGSRAIGAIQGRSTRARPRRREQQCRQ